jgi:hypothetical protein
MKRSIATVLLVLAGATLAGCVEPHPYIRSGNARSVEIGYGADVASTLPLARQHCAQFERTASLVNAGENIALYDCIGR